MCTFFLDQLLINCSYRLKQKIRKKVSELRILLLLELNRKLKKVFNIMPYLTEYHKIESLMLIEYGDRTRTQNEVIHLFRDKYPDLPPYRKLQKARLK